MIRKTPENRQKSCTNKIRFKTYKRADKNRQEQRKKHGRILYIYWCATQSYFLLLFSFN